MNFAHDKRRKKEKGKGRTRFPQRRAFAESGAANAVFLYDLTREKGVLKSPQAFQNPKLKIYFPLSMRKAQRRAFPIVL